MLLSEAANVLVELPIRHEHLVVEGHVGHGAAVVLLEPLGDGGPFVDGPVGGFDGLLHDVLGDWADELVRRLGDRRRLSSFWCDGFSCDVAFAKPSSWLSCHETRGWKLLSGQKSTAGSFSLAFRYFVMEVLNASTK